MLLLARFQDLQALEPVICLARFPSTLQVPSGLVEGKAGTPATILQWHYKIISESSKRRVHSCVLFVRMTWRKMKGGELSYSWGILYQGVQKENLLAIGLSAVWSPGWPSRPAPSRPAPSRRWKNESLETPVAGRQVGPSDSVVKLVAGDQKHSTDV